MRKPWFSLLATSVSMLTLFGAHGLSHAQAAPSAAQARVIVKFKAGASLMKRQALMSSSASERAASLSQRVGLALASGAAVSDRMQVVTAEGIGSAALAERLSAQADVEYAVPDLRRRRAVAPNDPRYTTVGGTGPASGQWYLRAPTATVRSSIDVEPAWDITIGSTSVVVAVLDTGVRFDHNDLLAVASGGNLLPGYDMIAADPGGGFATAADGNGRDADPSDPGDYVAADECGPGELAEDSSWHGTQTSSLIGALTNNNLGMASVGRNVRVLPVRVLGKCGGYDSDIVAGMRWAAGLHVDNSVPDNTTPAKVINMSLGGDANCSTVYRDAMTELTAAGVVVVASAGNSAGHAVSAPASCSGVIGVTGLRHIGTKVGFADIGPEVALAAPGGNCVNTTGACLYPILTATNAGTAAPVANSSVYSSSFNVSVGTSFSAPLVAGTVALMFSARPGLTVAEVRSALQAGTRPFPTTGSDSGVASCSAPTSSDQLECYCTTSTCGAGMLDAGKSVAAAELGLQARITLSADRPVPMQAVTLNAGNSFVLASRTLSSYQWVLVDGGGIVTAVVPNGATATVTPSDTGQFTVSLAVTDSSGATSTTTRTVDVLAAPAAPPPLISGGGDSGGGALGLAWLFGLALGVMALQWQRVRAQRSRRLVRISRASTDEGRRRR